MALNFPSSPNVNATYTFNDKTWTYNGNAWALSYGTLNTGLVPEGSNLYFSNARARTAISVTGSGTYDSNNGIITISQSSNYGDSNVALLGYATNANVALKANVADLKTANVAELTNLYFTNARATAAVTNSTLSNITLSGNINGTSALFTGAVTAGTLQTAGDLLGANIKSTAGAIGVGVVSTFDLYSTLNLGSRAANDGYVSLSFSPSGTFAAKQDVTSSYWALWKTYNRLTYTFSTNTLAIVGSVDATSNISASNVVISGNSRLGTVTSGTWNGSSISTTYTDAKVTSVNGQTGAATGFATTANSLSQFASTTSAQLATLISDETGTGSLVFAASPVLSGTLSVGGTANIMTSVSNTTAQIKVSPASGASNANSKINFQGTFFNYPADIGARLTATIKSGFSTGVWGTEYLDILVNNAANDISSEANQNRVVRVTKGDVDVTGNIITSGGIELGNASDTTIARSAAGVITVEGVEVVTLSRTQTLTNKTLTSPTLTTPVLGLATGTSVMLSANIGAVAGNVSGNFTAGNFQTTGNVNSASGLVTGSLTAGTLQTSGNVNTGNLRVTTNSTLGTVVSGTWNGSSISTTYTDAKVTAVNGSTGAVTGLATTAGTLAQFGATTSAQLLGVISDETGSGALVFATSPTLVTPALGTPASGTLTNCTFPTLNQNTTGSAASATTATNATNTNITNDTTTNASFFPTFVSTTSGNLPQTISNTKLFFNPSTGLLTSTDYNSSSDKRLKKNIKTVDSALDKVIALRGVTFDWKEGGAKAIGLIAQEVEKVIPEIVSQDESGYLGIKYNNLIGVLIEAIKEQQEQINTLKKLIEKQ